MKNILKPTSNNVNQTSMKKRVKRRITIAGDSILGGINRNRMRKSVSREDILYLKNFSGSNVSDMKDYIKPSVKHSPSLIVFHVGSNDHRTTEDAAAIADEIINLAKSVKADNNVVLISGIVVRRDGLWQGMNHGKLSVAIQATSFVVNSNMNLSHLNASGLHLNDFGSWQLATNLVDCINAGSLNLNDHISATTDDKDFYVKTPCECFIV